MENASKVYQEEAKMTARHIHERVGMRLYQIAEQLEHLKSLLYQSQHNDEKLQKEKFDRCVRKSPISSSSSIYYILEG